MKSIIAICLILGLVGTAIATESTNSPGSGFNRGPFKILSAATGGNTTDIASWGSGNTNGASSAQAYYSGMYTKFGPGADNTTLWLYSLTDVTAVTSSSVKYYAISRKLDQTILSNGTSNDAENSVVKGSDGVAANWAPTGTPRTGAIVTGTAPGVFLLANSETTSGQDKIMLYILTGGSSSVASKTIVTGAASVAWVTAATDGVVTALLPVALWSEDGAYYVLYEQQVETCVKTGATCPGTASYAQTSSTLYIQGQYANGTAAYTTAPSVAAVTTQTTFGTQSVTSAVAGGNNYTNSSMWLVLYKDTVATAPKVSAYTVARTSGTATSAGSFTDTTTSGNAATYTVGGIVPSVTSGSYGFIIGQYVDATTDTYNISILTNGSSALVWTGLTISSPYATTPYLGGSGFRNGTNYGVIGVYQSAATTYTYVMNVFYTNGTAAMSTQTTIGTFSTYFPPSMFVDVNGSLWFGYGTAETTTPYTVDSASIVRLVQDVTYYWPSTAGNALVTFAALLSFVVMSLFMF